MAKKKSVKKTVKAAPRKKAAKVVKPAAKKSAPKKKVVLDQSTPTEVKPAAASGPLWGKQRLLEEKVKREIAKRKMTPTGRKVREEPEVQQVPPPKLSDLLAPKTFKDTYFGPHGMVKARAGTGKTWTLVMGLAWMFRDKIWKDVKRELGFEPKPSEQQSRVWQFMDCAVRHIQPKLDARISSPKSVTYCAFNKAIVTEFGQKYSWMVELLKRHNVEFSFSTINSIGYQTCSKQYRLKWGSTSDYRTNDLLAKIWNRSIEDVWKEKYDIIQAVNELVDLSKLTLTAKIMVVDHCSHRQAPVVGPKELRELATTYEIEMDEDIEEEVWLLVNQILVSSYRVEDNKLSWPDQVWLPVVHNLPVWKRDLLLVDEGQDLNPCQQRLACMAGHRIIIVGDEQQAIYGFAGADVKSMPNMQTLLGDCPEFPLTETRRCGKVIVRGVQHIVPDFTAHENNCEGKETYLHEDQFLVGDARLAEPGDMVLCRVNAPIISLAFKLLRAGRPVNIQGRDIGQMFKKLIKGSKAKTVAELLTWVDHWEEKQRARLEKKRNGKLELSLLKDKKQVILTLATGADTIKGILDNIDSLFKDLETGDRKEVILLSSIHRAKGLEAKKVFILRYELLPHPMATSESAREQEKHLEYVARTRAIEELVLVRGADAEREGEE